jgi:hypothetical protein
MGFRFNRRISIFKGLRLNFSKSGTSVSVGGRGAWLTFGKKGTRATVGIPGTGMSWSEKIGPTPPNGPNSGWSLGTLVRLLCALGFLGIVLYALFNTLSQGH